MEKSYFVRDNRDPGNHKVYAYRVYSEAKAKALELINDCIAKAMPAYAISIEIDDRELSNAATRAAKAYLNR